MRSHENTPLRLGRRDDEPDRKDTLQVIDKQTLEPVAQVRRRRARRSRTSSSPATAATRWPACGRWTARWSSTTRARFKEVKRIPMSKPVGKYNVYNKITRSEGTSH